MGTNASRAIILDRDGTLIVDRDYLFDPAEVELLPTAAAGLRQLRAAGWRLVLITNQSGIARGKFTHDDVKRVHARLAELLAAEDVVLDGIYYCPHSPDDGCDCRKPRDGLIRQAAAQLHFDPTKCVVIGDKVSDVELGRAIGGQGILVRTGQWLAHVAAATPIADAVVDDLPAAAEWLARNS